MAHNISTDTRSGSDPILKEPAYVSSSPKIPMLVSFYLLLFGLNLIRVFVILPWEEHLNDVLASVLELIDKVSIWIGLTYLFVISSEKQPFLRAVKLKGYVLKGILAGLLGSLFLVLLTVIQVIMKHQALHAITISSLFGLLPLWDGLIEEIPFRGFLQKHLQTYMSFSTAALLNSVLFVSIHIPLWLSTGMGIHEMLQNGAYIFILALIFCVVVHFSKSLWSSVIIHTVNNLLSLF